MAFSRDGATLYVAAFGSAKVGVLDTAELEAGELDAARSSRGYLELSGGGPSGLALDHERRRLYVMTRFDNSVAWIDLESGTEAGKIALPDPEPAAVTSGRPFLYDAVHTSSNGEASCAGCHVFGDVDALAWDLGDPGGEVTRSPIPILREDEAHGLEPPINGTGDPRDFHPMKGPMTTQTLRGLARSGALHWRGDRATGPAGTHPGNAEVAFRNFVVAFPGLLGHRARLRDAQMKKFARFVLRLVPPPNPVRALDNSLTPRQAAGRELFESRLLSGGVGDRRCRNCHTVEPLRGRFGTGGHQAFVGQTQIFKVPHLRGLYQKVGKFGLPQLTTLRPGDASHQGDQVRGFGFLHDGSIDTLFRFLKSRIFTEDEDESEVFRNEVGFKDDGERRDLERFLLAFDTDLAPIVGQQVTLTAANAAAVGPRLDLMIERAEAPFVSEALGGVVTECELIVKGVVGGEPRGGLYDPVERRFVTDRAAEGRFTAAAVRGLARQPGQELTFTCVPPGSGRRTALDRDEDGFYDRDELDAGSDPSDAASLPQ